jgi:hypothetical protein
MIECNGGPGTDTFDMLGVMRQWVERGEAPNDVAERRRRTTSLPRVEHGTVADAAAVPVPAGGERSRQRQHGRYEELRLPIASNVIVCRAIPGTIAVRQDTFDHA